jgi:hypothetical protein
MNPDVLTQSVSPRAFKANQEDKKSFWVENGQPFLTRSIAKSFVESKISKTAMHITQSVRRPIPRDFFGQKQIIADTFPVLKDNPISNHIFSWAPLRYEDRILRFTLMP